MTKLKIRYEFDLKTEDGFILDGKCYKIRKEIVINANLGLKDRAITLGHELIHYLGYRAFNFRASLIIDNILDFSNFLIEKHNLKSLIEARFGLKSLIKRIKGKISMYDYVVKTYPHNILKLIFESCKLKNKPKFGLEWLRDCSLSPKTKKAKNMESQNVKTQKYEAFPVSTASGKADFNSREIKSQNNVKGGKNQMNSFESFRMSQKAKIEARLQSFQLKQRILRPKSKEAIDLAKFRPLGLIAEFKGNFELEIPFYIETKDDLETLMRNKQNFKVVNGKTYIKNPYWK